jgi:hypothetical protein
VQQARSLALDPGEKPGNSRFPIRDRGPNFTASLDAAFQAAGTVIARTAVQAPRMNATCQRLNATPHRELPDQTQISEPGEPARRPGRVPAALQHPPGPTRAPASPSQALIPVPPPPPRTPAPGRSPENHSRTARSTNTSKPPDTRNHAAH